tara:strand:- start:1086 stop:1784 length:699 start_codon:yes stop_codon:yes gene_type:complete
MAYGISVTGNDTGGNYTVTDTALDLVNYAVVATGTGYQVDLTSTQGQRPILLVRGNQTANQGYTISSVLSGNYRVFKRINFTVSGSTGEKEIQSIANATGLEWILLKDMTGITPSTGAGDYGLQIFTAAGATAFDSRSLLTNSTAQIKAVWGPGTRSGNNASLTTDSDLYCDSGWFFYQSVSEGDSLSGVLWNVGGSFNGIRLQNWINLGLEEFGGSSTTHFSNFSTIVLGE